MNLKNSRIIIVDDDWEDVKKLLSFFDKEGIPYNYYKGPNEKSLPKKPLKDVRVLFLDFDLGVGGQFSVKNKISVLMGVYKKLLAKDNGPYVLIAWTTYNTGPSELITPFKTALMSDPTLPKPVMIFDMEKSAVMNDLKGIERNIKKAFNGSNVFELLLRWGNHADAAVSQVLNNLLSISVKKVPTTAVAYDDYTIELNKAMQFHVYKFAAALLGKNLKANKDLLVAGQVPFVSFFQDFIESAIKDDGHNFKNLQRSTYNLNNPSSADYTLPERAELNSIFLLDSKPDTFAQPGNIYKAEPIFRLVKTGSNFHTKKLIPKKPDFIQEFVQPAKYNTYKDVLSRKSVLILIEITPECDFAQKKWKAARFILGALLPYDLDNSIFINDTKSFFKQNHDPLPVKYKGQVYWMVFHTGYHFNLSISQSDKVAPILKARKELLVDVQHWLAAHISRPGKTVF